ncbi:hypothetical protein CesoFtcFv8_012687 [Champsocephalus esox]|uniref:Uncharacterized protein n=1 Tax=Champsocephalus esox TaxID=159716 RepID=A0AAN8BUV4_9TELE|nr:hypothetical protein CesoFtcFv8_012687 [Champsocephalus esox]
MGRGRMLVEMGGGRRLDVLGVVGHLERRRVCVEVGWGRVEMLVEEVRRGRRHGGAHIVVSNVKRRWAVVGGGRLSVHVLLLLVPHRSPWSSAAPGVSANQVDVLHRLDALPGVGAVRVAESLDRSPFSAGGH